MTPRERLAEQIEHLQDLAIDVYHHRLSECELEGYLNDIIVELKSLLEVLDEH